MIELKYIQKKNLKELFIPLKVQNGVNITHHILMNIDL